MTRLHPDSIIGWTLVVLLAALSVSQLATIAILYNTRSNTLQVVEHFHIAERIADIVRLMDAVPPEQRPSLLSQLTSDTLFVSWDGAPAVTERGNGSWSEVLFDDVVGAALWQAPERAHRAALRPTSEFVFEGNSNSHRKTLDRIRGPRRIIGEAMARRPHARIMLTAIALADGTWLNFQVPMADPPRSAWFGAIAAIAASGLLVVALSVWAVRRLTLPMAVMAQAAEHLGHDVNAPPLPETGSREMRQAARAFNTMQERLRRFVTDRIQMIAAISHDLRTPITRIRLRTEFADNEETRDKMRQDLAEMEAMIEATLQFARGEASPEPRALVDLGSLLESVCDDLPSTAVRIDESAPQRLLLECQPMAMRRCIGNLAGNAVKYGSCAHVTVSAQDGTIRIIVDDEGPGIAAEDRERVFEPFLRLDSSRNRATGGVGLGLTISRAVARAHGGDVLLTDRPEGGLRATLQLPMPLASFDHGAD